MREDSTSVRVHRKVRDILTIPQSDHAIPASANECVPPELYGTYKVLVHFPSTIGVRWSGDGEASDQCSGSREERTREPGGGRGWRVRDCPKNVHGRDALSCCEIPLAHCLVRGTGDLPTLSILTHGRSRIDV